MSGAIRERQKDFKGAIADYTEAIHLEPKDYNYAYRGNAYSLAGDFDSAILDFRRALKSDTEAWWGWYDKIGSAYAEKADFTNAIIAYEQALALKPTDAKREQEIQDFIYKNSGSTIGHMQSNQLGDEMV